MLIISILLTVAAIVTVSITEKKLPKSISALVWSLSDCHRWLWSCWLWIVVLTLAPSLFEAMPESCSLPAFLSVVCLMFVGAFPLFDNKHENLHIALAVIGGILSQVCVMIICPWCLLTWIVFLVLFVWNTKDHDKSWNDWYHGVFVAEIICMAALYMSVFKEVY